MKDSSRKEERMLILNMVAEGKISVDESLKLLESLNAGQTKEDFTYDYNYDFDFEEKVSKFSKSVDEFAKEMKDKFSVTFKDVEPKVKKATKTVVQKTVSVLDEISSSLNETLRNLDENNEADTPADNGFVPNQEETVKDDDDNNPIPN